MGQAPRPPRIAFGPKGQSTVTVDLDATWQVEYGLALQPPGRPVVIQVRVALRPGVEAPPGGLLAETLKRVRIGDHARHLEAMVKENRRPPASPAVLGRHREEVAFREGWMRWAGLGPVIDAVDASARREARPSGGPGRPQLSDEVLARAAQAYVSAIDDESPRPVLDAAARLGETPERLRDLLHRARRRGLLGGGKSGVAGGVLTPQARAVLKQQSTTKRRKR